MTVYFIRSSQLFNRGSNNINNKYISSGTIGRTYQQQAFSEETLGIEATYVYARRCLRILQRTFISLFLTSKIRSWHCSIIYCYCFIRMTTVWTSSGYYFSYFNLSPRVKMSLLLLVSTHIILIKRFNVSINEPSSRFAEMESSQHLRLKSRSRYDLMLPKFGMS